MNIKKIIVTILSLLTLRGVCQLKTGGSIDFYCNGQLFSIDYGVWIDPIQNCDKSNYKMYFNIENFKDIPPQDTTVIEKIKISIKQRAGLELYNRLILQNVIVSKRPKKCQGQKYTLRYIMPLDTVFYYRFSLTYDIHGNLLSDPKFPDVKTNTNILSYINYCQAIQLALSDSVFRKAYHHPGHLRSKKDLRTGKWENIGELSKIELGYDKSRNVWIWQLFTETVFDGDKNDLRCVTGNWVGKKIIINAQNSTIIQVEDYKEFKTVTYVQ